MSDERNRLFWKWIRTYLLAAGMTVGVLSYVCGVYLGPALRVDPAFITMVVGAGAMILFAWYARPIIHVLTKRQHTKDTSTDD
ncbi:MAG: hypothetical protein ABWX96_21370 [Propionibacteriaceae bacterium]